MLQSMPAQAHLGLLGYHTLFYVFVYCLLNVQFLLFDTILHCIVFVFCHNVFCYSGSMAWSLSKRCFDELKELSIGCFKPISQKEST